MVILRRIPVSVGSREGGRGERGSGARGLCSVFFSFISKTTHLRREEEYLRILD